MTKFQHASIVSAMFIIASGEFAIAGGPFIGVSIVSIVLAVVILAQNMPTKPPRDKS